MVKHVILWKLKEGVENPQKVKEDAKVALEALADEIGEISYIKVNINGYDTSSCDMMLDSAFETFEDYEKYKFHPSHVKAADTYVRPYVDTRLCLDFEE